VSNARRRNALFTVASSNLAHVSKLAILDEKHLCRFINVFISHDTPGAGKITQEKWHVNGQSFRRAWLAQKDLFSSCFSTARL
jgi:hypothetical protein